MSAVKSKEQGEAFEILYGIKQAVDRELPAGSLAVIP